jgi:hypothetical protein
MRSILAHFHTGCICRYITLSPNYLPLVGRSSTQSRRILCCKQKAYSLHEESKVVVQFSSFDQMLLFVIQVIKSC